MSKFVAWTLMGALSAWLAAGAARACPPDEEGGDQTGVQTMVISMVGGDGQPIVLTADGGASAGCAKGVTVHAVPAGQAKGDARFITLTSDDGKAFVPQGPMIAHVMATTAVEDPEALKNRGWLGVQIGGVPESLSDQLALDEKGTMVLNVAEGSPADKAGIEQHDVIVAINGNEIEGGVEKFVEAVRSQKPGDKIDLKVLRNGKEMNFNGVELAGRDTADFKWKFDFSPMAEVEEHVNTRGRVLLKNEKGDWVMQDLGNLQNLPDEISKMLPKAEHRAMVYIDSSDGGSKTVKIKVNRDGETTEIARENGGEIKVTRTDKNGTVTENTYANEDDLKAADTGAYDLLQGHSGPVRFQFGDGAAPNLGDLDIDIDGAQADLGNVRVEVQKSMDEAQKAYEEAMKHLKNFDIKLPDGAAQGMVFQPGTPGQGPFGAGSIAFGKPKHTFEVAPDGHIDVRIRKGDSELVQKYTNEQDLQTRDPDLYAKYQDLMSEDRE